MKDSCRHFPVILVAMILLFASLTASVSADALIIEKIEVQGNLRTSAGRIIAVSGLATGDPATPETIHSAAHRLRSSSYFSEVEVYTRAGTAPGRVVVVFSVSENRPHFRLGMGYEDLSGWYLIPLQLNLDNLTGHGEILNLSARVGWRLSGLVLTYQNISLSDPRRFFELQLKGESVDRLYFLEGTEISQVVSQSGLGFHGEVPVADHLNLGGWFDVESFEPDSSAEVYRKNEMQDRREGDIVPFEDLPTGIQSEVGRRTLVSIGMSLGIDTRRGGGLRTRGLWGRTLGEYIFSEKDGFPAWHWDLRAYTPIGSRLQLSARSLAGSVSSKAPFYKRYYLGGLYTVRGYPSHSLSTPEGHLNFATLSLELRAAWIGAAVDPLLTGLVFCDLGTGWNDRWPDAGDISAGIGYGFRLRMPWIGRLGLDIGYPLNPSPVKESFHINASIGWTF
ncbi:MAG: BamA/TamA family outer membrane protein [Candidatus Eisenbacteria bacterium]|uniref:BamA/TamA family outer membrane protein n=1 Tax=Eiseniibacteriota bacterium TaxID=2212470 RepID=A0A948RRZ4_UNCEI|nr:BamA/TamA family outer membrane protein [Candidatus Eisenbacteria bacterium]MBU1950015.1 BamA/TamA family outer membrane protein [Candidatus Eisenbacteria bacterium]MBU2689913.1 BamA/TamA family outer membrane protein [Candidatus Eisenbacteria bacterium]